VRGASGAFHLPPLEKGRKPWNHRILWAEIEEPSPEHFVIYDPVLFKERMKAQGVEVPQE